MPDLNADRRKTNKVQTAERNGGVRHRPTLASIRPFQPLP
jgi:hypothetical protein